MDIEKEKPAAPTAVAAIDVGSNSVRMAVAQVMPDGSIEVLERMQRPVRLGQDTFVHGRLSQATINAATAVFRDYRQVLETYQVKHVRAVATSAVREAANADAFVDRVFTAINLEVEVIEPMEESRLTVQAVLQAAGEALDVRTKEVLIADVGGGSALLTLLHQGEITASGSYRMGSIRLREMLETSQEPAERGAELLRHHLAGTMQAVRAALPLKKVRCFIAVGGDARFAARRIGKPIDQTQLHTVEAKSFDKLVEACAPHAAEDLAQRYDLPFADAETLVPALLAYQCLLHETKARQMVVSGISMRDGLLLDLARAVRGTEDTALANSIIQSARAIGEKYHNDAAHAEHVAELAVQIFDALKREHGLGLRHRLLLRVAGLLHEVGGYVSSQAHHKHSYYLISNSEIFGLRRGELAVVALVARYHRRSDPKPTHIEYMAQDRETRMVVSKLAAILRVADALDRGHAQQIRDLQFERLSDELVICVPGAADLTLERRALSFKSDMFEDIYGMKVRLEEAPASGPDARRAASVE